MTKARTPLKLHAFDAARYLDSDEAIAEYMTSVLETDDPDLLLLALGDVARARGMAQVAGDAGLGRESLYKALTPGAKRRFDTVLKVTRALGVKFTAHRARGLTARPTGPCPASVLWRPLATTVSQRDRRPLGVRLRAVAHRPDDLPEPRRAASA